MKFSSQRYRKDVIVLEWGQGGFTKMLPGIEQFSYEEGLKKLGLCSLE